MNKSFWLAVAAYLIPTFLIGYFWHLALFAERYHQLYAGAIRRGCAADRARLSGEINHGCQDA